MIRFKISKTKDWVQLRLKVLKPMFKFTVGIPCTDCSYSLIHISPISQYSHTLSRALLSTWLMHNKFKDFKNVNTERPRSVHRTAIKLDYSSVWCMCALLLKAAHWCTGACWYGLLFAKWAVFSHTNNTQLISLL